MNAPTPFFAGSIGDAINEAKQRNCVLLVLLRDGELPWMFEEGVLNACSDVVCMDIEAGTESCVHFGAIYPVGVFPMFYFLNPLNGQPVNCVAESISSERFLAELEIAKAILMSSSTDEEKTHEIGDATIWDAEVQETDEKEVVDVPSPVVAIQPNQPQLQEIQAEAPNDPYDEAESEAVSQQQQQQQDLQPSTSSTDDNELKNKKTKEFQKTYQQKYADLKKQAAERRAERARKERQEQEEKVQAEMSLQAGDGAGSEIETGKIENVTNGTGNEKGTEKENLGSSKISDHQGSKTNKNPKKKQDSDPVALRQMQKKQSLLTSGKERRKDRQENDALRRKTLAKIENAKKERQKAPPGDQGSSISSNVGSSEETPEPKLRSSAKTRLAFRLFNGETLRGEFPSSGPLRAALDFIDENRTDGDMAYKLKISYPPRVLSLDQVDTSLGDLGLSPSAQLILVVCDSDTRMGGNPTKFKPTRESSLSWLISLFLSFFSKIYQFIFGSNSASNGSGESSTNRASETKPNSKSNLPSRKQDRKYGQVHRLDHHQQDDKKNSYYNGNSTMFGGDGDE